MGDEQGRELGLAHPQADPEAGDPRLGDLELRRPDPVAVADADLLVAQVVDGEVVPELAVLEPVPAEELLPVAVGVELVDEHGALLAAVARQVALSVTVDVELAGHARPVDRTFPDPGVDGSALPLDVLGQADVQGEQRCHGVARAPQVGGKSTSTMRSKAKPDKPSPRPTALRAPSQTTTRPSRQRVRW